MFVVTILSVPIPLAVIRAHARTDLANLTRILGVTILMNVQAQNHVTRMQYVQILMVLLLATVKLDSLVTVISAQMLMNVKKRRSINVMTKLSVVILLVPICVHAKTDL